nr:hypothetical protein [Tanacetum cinerariifolium]
MAILQFCDYHNMVAISEKGEFNTNIHPMVDFITTSPLRIETMDEGIHILATVDGIQRTMSESSPRRNLKLRDEDGIVFIPDMEHFENLTLMGIETTDEGTHILATVDGIQRTMSEASLRRNLKLRDEDGIVSIPDTELFENLTLMGIVPLFDAMLIHQGEGSGTPTEPHHTPFPEVESSHPTTSSILLPSIPTAPIPTVTQTYTTPIIQYSKRERIAQSSALPTIADEPASPVRDDTPAVTSLAADEGNGFIPTAGPPATVISTGSEVGPIASPIVRRRKGKEVMAESDTPKKKKLQEQIDAQVARELEEQQVNV